MTDYTLRKTIDLSGGRPSITVRGLSLADITQIVHRALPMVTDAVERYTQSTKDVFTTRSWDGFVTGLVVDFPELAKLVIQLAAEDPEFGEAPAGLQSRLLITIAELTLEDMGDLTDPSPALAALIRQAAGALVSRLQTGSQLSSAGLSAQ